MIRSFLLFISPLIFVFFFNFPCLGGFEDSNNFSHSRPTKQKSQYSYDDLYPIRAHAAANDRKSENSSCDDFSFLQQQVRLVRFLLMPLVFDPSIIFEFFKK